MTKLILTVEPAKGLSIESLRESLPAWTPAALMISGVLLLLFIVLNMLRRRYAAAGREENRTPTERIEDIRADADRRQRESLNALMADVEELTRRCAAHLDNKATRIDVLLKQADERIAALERASQAPEPVPTVTARAPTLRPARAPQPTPSDRDPMMDEIYHLADAGHSPLEIAQRLQQPTGKVELILALRESA